MVEPSAVNGVVESPISPSEPIVRGSVMEDCQKARAYLQEILGRDEVSLTPVEELICSHRRQRESVGAGSDRDRRSHSRLWFLPWRIRRWVQGY